ncbi:hypothetical protein GCM10022227_22700 [Streptomyces sedi]
MTLSLVTLSGSVPQRPEGRKSLPDWWDAGALPAWAGCRLRPGVWLLAQFPAPLVVVGVVGQVRVSSSVGGGLLGGAGNCAVHWWRGLVDYGASWLGGLSA